MRKTTRPHHLVGGTPTQWEEEATQWPYLMWSNVTFNLMKERSKCSRIGNNWSHWIDKCYSRSTCPLMSAILSGFQATRPSFLQPSRLSVRLMKDQLIPSESEKPGNQLMWDSGRAQRLIWWVSQTYYYSQLIDFSNQSNCRTSSEGSHFQQIHRTGG